MRLIILLNILVLNKPLFFRCMVWCRELVMAINRALFNTIDSKTNQLIEDRVEREKILRQHFERGFLVNQDTASNIYFDDSELIKIESENGSFFSWNSYNIKKRLVLFNLDRLQNSFDSLFLYTNINEPRTVIACKVCLNSVVPR